MKFTTEEAALVLPNRTIASGRLVVEDGRISAIDLTSTPLSTVTRLIMPGLVNCHGHTAMTLVRGLGTGLPLQRWLEEAIFPVEAKMSSDDIVAGVKFGAMEMLAGGTTTVADMYDFSADGERAFAEVGIRAVTNRVGLGFVPGRLEECISFTTAKPASELVRRDFCIHSEYLTNEKFCRDMAVANQHLKRRVHVHVSETSKEHEQCLQRYGLTPMAYLCSTGIFDYGGYAAHCVYCTDDDFKLMADKHITLVHNPSSNLKLGSGIARIVRARELGVNVALGTDGCASNDNLNMFEEMHLAALLAKGVNADPTCLSAWEVIEMATINGAKALGLDNGELSAGKLADFIEIDLDRLHLKPVMDIANLIVYSMQAADVIATYVGGVKLYERGSFLELDAHKVEQEFMSSVKRLLTMEGK